MALNHLESVPEKLNLLEECRDTGVRKISFDSLSTFKIFWLINNIYDVQINCLIRYLQLHMYVLYRQKHTFIFMFIWIFLKL